MNKLLISLLFVGIVSFANTTTKNNRQANGKTKDSIPAFMLGNFMDDYRISYNITDSLWTQMPGIKYHIIKWNTKEQYIIARNDDKNPSEQGLYSRIDYMQFTDMNPFLWGFCLTVYNAKTDSIAEFSKKADKENPRKGCNGYPFSRMKRI